MNTESRSSPSHVIVFNPASGAGEAERKANELARLLRDQGSAVELVKTEVDEDVFSTLPPCDVVVVVGGDGTFHQAANAISCRPPASPALAFLPSGTVNVLTHELGVPRDPRRCADLLRAGGRRSLSLLDVGGVRRFVLFLEVGFVARLVGHVNRWRDRTRKHGRLEFVVAYMRAVSTAWGTPVEVEEHRDGAWIRRGRCSNALVTRTRRYAERGIVPMSPSDGDPLDAASFEALLYRSRNPVTHSLVVGALVAGWLPRLEPWLERRGLIERFHARRVRFRGPDRLDIHADAETVDVGAGAEWVEVSPAGTFLTAVAPAARE